MRSVWRPERRNRNIGTASSGYSKLNEMRIPEGWRDKRGNYTRFYERLDVVEERVVAIGGCHVLILSEAARTGFTYGCGIFDVIRMLSLAAPFISSFPSIIAFRQPSRKQSQLNPVWGRFIYLAEFGNHRGSSIIIEAQEIGASLKWPKSMSLDDRSEFDRLIEEGHRFEETKRVFDAKICEQSVRNTILYRTLLHELGHWVQYQKEVLNGRTAVENERQRAEVQELYFSKPASEREAYANGFAARLKQHLFSTGQIPFDPLVSNESI